MYTKIGRFGILSCKLADPLSNIIDKITECYNNYYNSIGIYYINDKLDYSVILFNLYDTYPIKWVLSHHIISNFMSSQYIKNIHYYSLDENRDTINKNFQSIYNNYQNIIITDDNSKSKLEEKFNNIISGLTISYDYDKEENYENLLLNIVNNNTVGIKLINKILSLLDENNSCNDFTKSPLIKKITRVELKKENNYINIIDHNFENIISSNILKLKENFVGIYMDHAFLSKIDLSIFVLESNKNLSKSKNDLIEIKSLNIKSIEGCIKQIIKSKNKIDQSIAIKNLIITYNNMIVGYDFEPIDVNQDINIILNPDLIVSQSSMEDIMLVINSNIETQNYTDLSILTNTQLFDILVYIDSLRDISGNTNIKFSGVQNLITKELRQRKNKK